MGKDEYAMHTSKKLLGTYFAMALTASCFGSVAEVKHRHFLLDGKLAAPIAAEPVVRMAAPEGPATPALWVKDFQVDAVYDRAQLVRRRGPHEVSFVRNDVWAARVGRMVADAVARHWTHQELFVAINRTAGEANPDLTLQGEVTALEVLAPGGGTPPEAHLAWVLQLVARGTGKILAQHVFDDRCLLGGAQDGEAAVAALNVLIDRASSQGAQELKMSLDAMVKAP